MAITVFLFILLLGRVAGVTVSDDINKLVEEVERKCNGIKPTLETADGCQNFANAFREETNKGPSCTSADSNDVRDTYSTTISLLSVSSGQDKTLLWSGPGMIDEARKQSSKMTLGNTSVGESVYNLHWTKTKESADSLEWYSSEKVCDSYRTDACLFPLEFLYWSLASSRFAAQARGEVEVYLTNKTYGGPYAEQSIFRMFEVPHLKGTKYGVTKVTVKLYDIDKCENADLKQLKADLKARSISNYFCVEAGTSTLADTGDYSVTQTYWRPDGTCDSCMKLPSVITIIIPILTLLLKS